MPVQRVVGRIPEPFMLERRLRGLCILESIAGARFPMASGSLVGSQLRFRLEDGAGNDLNAVVASDAGFIQGFDHESPMGPYATESTCVGIFEGFPPALVDALSTTPTDDRFPTPDLDVEVPPTTFCVWWDAEKRAWTHGPVQFPEMDPLDDDGAELLISRLNPDRFVDELGWNEPTVRGVFELGDCDEAPAVRLNPSVDWARVRGVIGALKR